MISKEGYMDIQALYRQGMTVRAISRRLGLHRNTIKKHLASDEFPRYRCRRPDVEYVLRLPASIAGGIQDEIRLQRLDSRTFAARGP